MDLRSEELLIRLKFIIKIPGRQYADLAKRVNTTLKRFNP
jgi:hypothetical protein